MLKIGIVEVHHVDENDLPLYPNVTYEGHGIEEYCCKAAEENYIDVFRCPDSNPLEIESFYKYYFGLNYDTWDHGFSMVLPCCPYCQAKPDFYISKKIKRIKKCKEIINTTTQCSYEDKELDNL